MTSGAPSNILEQCGVKDTLDLVETPLFGMTVGGFEARNGIKVSNRNIQVREVELTQWSH